MAKGGLRERAATINTNRLAYEVTRALAIARRNFARRFKACRKDPSEKRVHALRIEARRLLSIIDLLERSQPPDPLKKIRRAAKKKLNLLDELRDLHVQTLALKHLGREFPALKALYKTLKKQEEQVARDVRKKLKRTNVQKLIKRIHKLQAEYARWRPDKGLGASALIEDAIDEAFATVVRRRAAINPKFTGTIHSTRIAFKKFRYMVEALPSTRRTSGHARLVRMQEYQTRMGQIQDMEVLLNNLEGLAKTRKKSGLTIKPMIAELARRHALLIRKCVDAADELFSFWDAGDRLAIPNK